METVHMCGFESLKINIGQSDGNSSQCSSTMFCSHLNSIPSSDGLDVSQ